MAPGINSIPGIAAGAPYAHQNSFQPTDDSIAGATAEGHSRRGVRHGTNPPLNAYPGQGARGVEACRRFNAFVEKAYIDKSSDAKYWSEQSAFLGDIKALVHESDQVPGICGLLKRFFKSRQAVSNDDALLASPKALLSDAETLAAGIREQEAALRHMQQHLGGLIQADIERADQLVKEIAQLNRQINRRGIQGANTPDPLLDRRNLRARQLAEIVGIDITDRAEGHYMVQTRSGVTLVHEDAGHRNFPAAEFTAMPPRATGDDSRSGHRLAGGTMSAHFELRDNLIGEYRDRLDAFAKALIRETNSSRNAGIENTDDKAYSSDASGHSTDAMAARGRSAIFKGGGAGDIAVSEALAKDFSPLDAAAVSCEAAEQTLLSSYSAYVAQVAADTGTARYNAALYGAMAADLGGQQGSGSGANLDEEMFTLIRFQNSYKAAAKLIIATDEMLQAILGLNQ